MTDRPREALVWAIETFGEVANDPRERTMRFLEEAIELAHAMGLDRATAAAIQARVYDRPQGLIKKEIGQAHMTLEVLAECLGLSAENEAAAEFKRVQAIPAAEWHARHAAKQAIGIAERR